MAGPHVGWSRRLDGPGDAVSWFVGGSFSGCLGMRSREQTGRWRVNVCDNRSPPHAAIPMTDTSRTLDLSELSEALRISRQTLVNWTDRGLIVATRRLSSGVTGLKSRVAATSVKRAV